MGLKWIEGLFMDSRVHLNYVSHCHGYLSLLSH